MRERSSSGIWVAVLAGFASALATGCCCSYDDRRGERSIVALNTNDARVDFRAAVLHEHVGNVDSIGTRITRLGRQKDIWSPLVEVFAVVPYPGVLATARGPSGDENVIGEQTSKLGVKQCQHPSGRAVVFRLTGTSMRWQDSDATGDAWRAVYGFGHSAAVANMHVPASEASTCEAAAARFPEPLGWVADELKAERVKPSYRCKRRVVVKNLDGVASTARFDEGLCSHNGHGSPIGFIVATQEGILLKEALDWALQHNVHGRTAFFRKAIEQGDVEGLSLHFLSRLEPTEVTSNLSWSQDDQLDEIVPVLRHEEAQRATLDKIASQCALAAHNTLCRGWQLRIAAKIAARLRDQPRCDRLLALLPDIGQSRELGLLRAARQCASPAAARKAAIEALGIKLWDVRSHDACSIDPVKPAPTEQCENLPLYAASLLVAECHPDGVQGARAKLKSAPLNIQKFAAACVIGRCEGRDAFRRAVSEAGISTPQHLIDVCGFDVEAAPQDAQG